MKVNTRTNGIQTVSIDPSITQIHIDFRNSLIDPIIPNVSDKEYQTMVKNYIYEYPNSGITDLIHDYHLPEECEIFLDSIKNNTPKEKVIACEEFVREYMRYDKDNSNSEIKSDLPLDQQIAMCYQHRNDLLICDPLYYKDILQDKLFV